MFILKILLCISSLVAAILLMLDNIFSAFIMFAVLGILLLILVIFSKLTKVFKIIFSVLLVIICSYFVIVCIDFYNFSNSTKPVFAKKTLDTINEVKYEGIGYDIIISLPSHNEESLDGAGNFYLFDKIIGSYIN